MAADDLSRSLPNGSNRSHTTYRGWTVYELPPNGQGMAALEMLNIMETTPASPDGPSSVPELHKKIEAMKLAYADLYRYDADPRFAKVPVQGLLSKDYAKDRAKLIDPNKANCNPCAGKPPASDTTYLTAVDHEGNIVSLIQSNYADFGSGITVAAWDSSCRIAALCFRSTPNRPTCSPRASVPSTPSFPPSWRKATSTSASASWAAPNQPLAHAQFVSNIVDYGMNIQAALENARFTVSRQGRLQYRDRVARARRRARQTHRQGPSVDCPPGILHRHGTRSGGHAGFKNWDPLRRLRPKNRRLRRTRGTAGPITSTRQMAGTAYFWFQAILRAQSPRLERPVVGYFEIAYLPLSPSHPAPDKPAHSPHGPASIRRLGVTAP